MELGLKHGLAVLVVVSWAGTARLSLSVETDSSGLAR